MYSLLVKHEYSLLGESDAGRAVVADELLVAEHLREERQLEKLEHVSHPALGVLHQHLVEDRKAAALAVLTPRSPLIRATGIRGRADAVWGRRCVGFRAIYYRLGLCCRTNNTGVRVRATRLRRRRKWLPPDAELHTRLPRELHAVIPVAQEIGEALRRRDFSRMTCRPFQLGGYAIQYSTMCFANSHLMVESSYKTSIIVLNCARIQYSVYEHQVVQNVSSSVQRERESSEASVRMGSRQTARPSRITKMNLELGKRRSSRRP